MENLSRYSDQSGIKVAAGWTLTRVTRPSTLFGANGMRFGPDGRLYVAQAFGSQVSAIDINSGVVSTVSPIGGEIVAPDDLAFDSHGVLYATEVMSERVCARSPNGAMRIIADQVPGANGITAYQDRLFMDECRPGGCLFELFTDGRAPLMLAENLPLPNALSVGPDGNIYFPVLGANEIWRLPLSGGQPERFTNEVAIPTAVKFNSKGQLLSTQGRSGEILRFDLQSGRRTIAATMRAGIDNFVLTNDDRLFVSHFVDGGVAEIVADGRERVLVGQGFLGPLDIEVAGDGRLYAADGISMAMVERDGTSHRVGMLFDGHFPGYVRGLAAASSGALVTTTSAGAVVTYHPVTHEMTEHATDLQELYGVAMAPNGTIVVAEGGAGRVLQIDRAGVRVMARGLARPTGIASAGDGSCYVCEAGAGRVVQVNGGVNTVLEGLRDPQGLLRVSHELFVIDADAHELVGYSLRTKQRETIASNLPVGAPPGVTPKTLMGIAGLLPGPLRPFAGLTSASDGTIFLSADGDGSVLALRRT